MILNESIGGSSSSLVLEDVFDIKAASLDTSTSLFDDDPSLRSFPINNGLFDDDRMGTLWKPADDLNYDEITVLDTSDPPLHVLLGRTVEDCFRDFPSPSNLPSPLSDSTSSSPDTSPWCEHWHPLPKEDPDPAIDVVLDEMNHKMRIFDTGLPSSATPNQTPSSCPRRGQGGIGEVHVIERTYDLQNELGRSMAAAVVHPASQAKVSTLMQQACPPPVAPKAILRPCRSSTAIADPPSSPTSSSSESEAELLPIQRQLGSRASTPRYVSSSDEVPDSSSVPSAPSSKRASPLRRSDRDECAADDTLAINSRPPSKRPRTSPSPSIASSGSSVRPTTTHRKARISTSPSAGSSGSSSQSTRSASKHSKRFKCPEPWCNSTFSRLGDVNRHLKNAAAHVTSIAQLDDRARCSKCGENLSRADARKRHELKGSCGKRTIRKRGIDMPRMPQA